MINFEDEDLNEIIFELTHTPNEDGEPSPFYCFATDITSSTEMTEEEVVNFALQNGYSAINVFPGETMVGGYIILAKDCPISMVEDMYKNFYGEEPDFVTISLDKDGNLTDSDKEVEEMLEGFDENDDKYKNFVQDIAALIDDEREAIDGYLNTLERVKNNPNAKPEDKETLQHINSEEVEHIKELSNILMNKANDLGDEELDEEKVSKNQLKSRARIHKKSDKKGSMGWFKGARPHKGATLNPNAGNVEANVAHFNHVMGAGEAQADGGIGAVSSVGGASMGSGMGEDLEKKVLTKSDNSCKIKSEDKTMDKEIKKEIITEEDKKLEEIKNWTKKTVSQHQDIIDKLGE